MQIVFLFYIHIKLFIILLLLIAFIEQFYCMLPNFTVCFYSLPWSEFYSMKWIEVYLRYFELINAYIFFNRNTLTFHKKIQK